MKTTASEFDEKFNKDESVIDDLDLSKARRPGEEQKRVNVDFPTWMIVALDREAKRVGVTRQSIIKMWLAEHLRTHMNVSGKQ
ncbi:MAG: CopG family transcriptional regulator [Anaerolineales bacterium]|jgi:hypothetical protein